MSRIYHVRSEGNNSTSGTTGSPTIVVSFTFYESNPSDVYFYIQTHSRPEGLSGIFSADTLVASYTVTNGGSWRVRSTGIDTCTLSSLGTAYSPNLGDLPAILWEWNVSSGSPSISADNHNLSQDDNFIKLYIPWTVTFLGRNYATGDVYLGSNTYLTFGAGSTNYSGLTASNPNLPKIMIGCADNSFQRVRASSGAIAVAPSLGNFDMTRTFGESAFTITQPSSNSSGAFTYSVISGTSVISISGTTVTIASAGTATVQASQAASGNFTAATQNATITINQATPSLTVSKNKYITKYILNGTINFDVFSTNASGFTRQFSSNNGGVITVPSASSPNVTIAGPGRTTINVTQSATTNYTAVTLNAIIEFVIVGQNQSYSDDMTFLDLAGTNLSGSVFNSCNLTGADLYNTTVNASTNFTTSTLTGVKSGRITGVTSLLPAGYIMI